MTLQVQKAYAQARSRLLLLDYDGTLSPFASHPSLAQPSARLLTILRRLTEDPRNTVVIVSGRPHHTLEEWLGGLPVHFIAEHGAFTKHAGDTWHTELPSEHPWMEPVDQLLQHTADTVAKSFVEHKASALVWHYRRAADTDIPKKVVELTRDLQPLAKRYNLFIVPGNRMLEVRVGGVNKGQAAQPWILSQSWDFILAAGDDTTDEDLFTGCPTSAYTIKVGPGHTKARAVVAGPSDFQALLETLI